MGSVDDSSDAVISRNLLSRPKAPCFFFFHLFVLFVFMSCLSRTLLILRNTLANLLASSGHESATPSLDGSLNFVNKNPNTRPVPPIAGSGGVGLGGGCRTRSCTRSGADRRRRGQRQVQAAFVGTCLTRHRQRHCCCRSEVGDGRAKRTLELPAQSLKTLVSVARPTGRYRRNSATPQ